MIAACRTAGERRGEDAAEARRVALEIFLHLCSRVSGDAHWGQPAAKTRQLEVRCGTLYYQYTTVQYTKCYMTLQYPQRRRASARFVEGIYLSI